MKPIILLVEDDEDDIPFFKDALNEVCLNVNFFMHIMVLKQYKN